jgi:hypothetical protein
MKGIPAIYLGRIIQKDIFRAFVYGPNGQKKLVESWDEFEASMQSGVWFSSFEEAEGIIASTKVIPKPRPKRRHKSNVITEEVEVVDESEDVLKADSSVFEVSDDF